MTLLDRDRADILATVRQNHAKAMRAARAAQAEGNTPTEDYWLGRAGRLQEWITALETPIQADEARL